MEGTNKRKLSIMLVVILLMQIILPVLTEISCLWESLAVETTEEDTDEIDEMCYEASYDNPVYWTGAVKIGVSSEDGSKVGTEFYYQGIKYKVTDEPVVGDGKVQIVGIDPKATEITILHFLKNLYYLYTNNDRLYRNYVEYRVEGINEGAAKGNTNLEKVTIRTGKSGKTGCIRYIGESTFEGCTNLKKVDIKGVDNEPKLWLIDKNAFKGCTSLTTINLPTSLTEIGDYAFADCSLLTEINLPSSLTEIGTYAFSECSSLTTIYIPNSITTIPEGLFKDCKKLENVLCLEKQGINKLGTGIISDGPITTIGKYAFYNCKLYKTLIIPNTCSLIKDFAFAGVTGVDTICNNAKKTSKSAFYGCLNKKYEQIDGGNYIDNGILYSKDKNTLISYPNGLDNEEFKTSVNEITKYSFHNPEKLEKIYFTYNDYMTINKEAFIDIDHPITIYCNYGTQTQYQVKMAIEYNESKGNTNVKLVSGEPTCIVKSAELRKVDNAVRWNLKVESNGNEVNKVTTNLGIVYTKDNNKFIQGITDYYTLAEKPIEVTIDYNNGKETTCKITLDDLGISDLINNIPSEQYVITINDNPTIVPINHQGCVVVKDLATITGGYTLEYSFDKSNWFRTDPSIWAGAGNYKIYIRKTDETIESKWKETIVTISTEAWEAAKKETPEETPSDKIKNDEDAPYIANKIIVNDAADSFDESKWYEKGTILLVEGWDAVSKSNVKYSFNGGEYSEENTYKMTKTEDITIKVKDEAGNESEEETIHIHVDKEAPKLSYELSTNENKTKAKIKLLASDDESGLAENIKIFREGIGIISKENYNNNNIIWDHDKGEITISEITENYIYFVFVYDKAGNSAGEAIYVGEEYVDKEGPIIENVSIIKTAMSETLKQDEAWINSDVKITIEAVDIISEDIEEVITTKRETEGLEYCFDYNVETKEGTWQEENYKEYNKKTDNIKVAVKDKSGNISIYDETINIPNIDKTNPSLNVVAEANSENISNGYTDKVILKIVSTDETNGSGLKGNFEVYLYDNKGEEIGSFQGNGLLDYDDFLPIYVSEPQAKSADVVVYDNAGNSAKKHIDFSDIKIDKTAPEITSCPETAKTGEKIEVEATDSESGIAGYNFEGTTWQTENTYTYATAGTYTIKVKDNAGNIAKQTIIVEAEDEKDPSNPTDPTDPEKLEVSTTIYKISETYIQEIQPETTLQAIIKDIKTNEKATIEIYDQKGNKITDLKQIAGTGMKIKITLGNESKEYEIVVRGDVDGDGYVNLDDMFEINKHRLGKVTLTGAKLKASDVNGDGKSDLNDMFKINKYRLGKINEI